MKKPKMSFWSIFTMSFGFLGIQCGLALQNANVSRILQNFGANVDNLSYFWLAAPLTGMIVQPIIGHYSDRTWCKLGRRRPYFLAGAILASLMLFLMPNASSLSSFMSPLMIGAGILMVMDASINVAMEPFRALVADKLPSEQRTLGFSLQTTMIGIGAVLGAMLPFILKNWFNVSNTPPVLSTDASGAASSWGAAPNVRLAFYIGAIVLISSVLITIFTTNEDPPDGKIQESQKKEAGFLQIFKDFGHIPRTMMQLGIVQFFSWFALFSMWVYMTPGVAEHCYGVTDPNSALYQEAGDWVGVLQAVYNAVAAVYAFALPWIAKKISRKATHAISLLFGALGFCSFMVFRDPKLLIISMVGVGIAWGSILAMPYAMLAGCLPSGKTGIYMGIFNFFITIPQICNGLLGGVMVKHLYGGHAIYALVFSGVLLLIACITVLFVQDKDDPVQFLAFKKKNVVSN
ncbi:MAG: MFS transporter [Bacteroidales bacterium]|jgi:maltose/moltooligosaccharide transporter|nr:MFS transporter [Bacteroidales bacterium]MCI2121336.1 MFS transporter [Bacteroidales bacterium]MCI2145913.1 MFS transporter [Bacteroidales bacterium]